MITPLSQLPLLLTTPRSHLLTSQRQIDEALFFLFEVVNTRSAKSIAGNMEEGRLISKVSPLPSVVMILAPTLASLIGRALSEQDVTAPL